MFRKNIVFFVSNSENVILPLLVPPVKTFLAHPWKIHYWPFPAKIFLTHSRKKNPSGIHV